MHHIRSLGKRYQYMLPMDIPSPIQVLAGLIAVIVLILTQKRQSLVKSFYRKRQPQYDLGTIEPVPDTFDLFATEPIAYRPFKPVYHMTMGIKKLPRQDWLVLDKLYLDGINENKKVTDKYPDGTCFVDEKSVETKEALVELYNYVFTTLSLKYPKQFQMSHDSYTNAILGIELPKNLENLSGHEVLRLIVRNVPDDFLLLQFDPSVQEYRLKAVSGVAANGFAVDKKMGLKLTDIHKPVPGYPQKLQMSMNRFFQKVIPGEFVQRLTWNVQVGTEGKNELFKPQGIHLHPDEEVQEAEEIDVAHNVDMRLERQILTRLPQSGMLAFSVRTYMYPLATIKSEGLGPSMADNIEAWPEEFAYYKSRPIWGKRVLNYLRSV